MCRAHAFLVLPPRPTPSRAPAHSPSRLWGPGMLSSLVMWLDVVIGVSDTVGYSPVLETRLHFFIVFSVSVGLEQVSLWCTVSKGT